VIIESTVPPGTCRDDRPAPAVRGERAGGGVVRPRLLSRTDLQRPGARRYQGSYPKVVGGVDEGEARVAALIYDQITDNDVIEANDATTAECV